MPSQHGPPVEQDVNLELVQVPVDESLAHGKMLRKPCNPLLPLVPVGSSGIVDIADCLRQ